MAPTVRADEDPLKAAREAFFSYARPATFESSETNLMIPTRDGTRLACTLYRPGMGGAPSPGQFPGIIHHYTPYGPLDNQVSGHAGGSQAARIFSTRGYNVLVCAIRGTWLSEGVWPGWFSTIEVQDNYDLIEWFATQPWSNGRIGQEGESYGGASAMRVAALRHPNLVAIAPQHAPEDLYLNIFYPGGIKAPYSTWSVGMLPVAMAQSRGGQDQLLVWQSHPLRDEYWRGVAVESIWNEIEVPTLIFGGWFDYMRRGDFLNFKALRSRAWLVAGPSEHGWAFQQYAGSGDGQFTPDGAGTPGSSFFDLLSPGTLLAWWDHWLREDETAPLPPTRVTSYELPRVDGAGWTSLPDMPEPAARLTRFHLRSDLTLGTQPGPSGSHSYAVRALDGPSTICFPPYGLRLRGLLPDPSPVGYPIPCDPLRDMRDVDTLRLAFTSPPLERDAVLTGMGSIRLRAALTAPDGNLVVKLHDVAPDGQVLEISVGHLKASHRLGHDRLAAIEPGTMYDFEFPLEPTHWRIRADHRLRVSLTSGDYPRIEADALPGVIDVAAGLDGSHIDLPLRHR